MAAPVEICHESNPIWHAERSRGLGGSDAPQILGISPFGGPARVAASKLGYRVEDAESELREWGHYVEEPLLRRFADETGIEARRSGILYRSGDPATPWLQATIDAVLCDPAENGGIQCKFALFTADHWDDGVPPHVGAQVQHEMAAMGWGFVYVLALLRGYQFRWARVERDERFIAERLLPAEGEFWRRLQADEAIEPAGAPDREWEALKARYPRPAPGLVVPLPGDEWVGLVDRWREAASAASAADKAAKELRNRLAAAMGEAEFAELDDGRMLSLSLTERAGYTVEAMSYRMLRVKGARR
jgi:predicted phage-related endonuclease